MQQFRFLLSFGKLCKRSFGVLVLDSQRKWSPWESGGRLRKVDARPVVWSVL